MLKISELQKLSKKSGMDSSVSHQGLVIACRRPSIFSRVMGMWAVLEASVVCVQRCCWDSGYVVFPNM